MSSKTQEHDAAILRLIGTKPVKFGDIHTNTTKPDMTYREKNRALQRLKRAGAIVYTAKGWRRRGQADS